VTQEFYNVFAIRLNGDLSVFNIFTVNSPPPPTDWRRQSLNRTDAKVPKKIPVPGVGGVAPLLKLDRRQGSVTNAKTAVRGVGGVYCRVTWIFNFFDNDFTLKWWGAGPWSPTPRNWSLPRNDQGPTFLGTGLIVILQKASWLGPRPPNLAPSVLKQAVWFSRLDKKKTVKNHRFTVSDILLTNTT